MLNLKRITNMLSRLTTSSHKPMLRLAAEIIRHFILVKTARGFDSFGSRFHAYSDKYKKAKAKKNDVSIVNLYNTGEMLGNLSQQIDDKECRVGFTNLQEAKKATYNQTGRVPRHFFGSSEESRKQIRQYVKEHIRSLMKGI